MDTKEVERKIVKYVNFDYSDAAANALENVYAITYAAHEIGYLTG